MSASETVGVYVHVPFCQRICPYCDFAVEASRRLSRADEDAYVEALLAELAERTPAFAGRALASLYFGGGTPSLLRPVSLARLRDAVMAAFAPAVAGVEITLEVNPSTTERERLPAFRSEAGVNRLSVVVQSFDDAMLKALGRAHRAEECHRTLDAAREAGFENLSLDLLFAGPGQTAARLERDLDAALRFAPEHVSAYELVLEERTPFGRAAAAGRLAPQPEDETADMIERIETRLGASGILRYELTNYARPGRESAHNLRYWAREPVLGLGVGAHSTDPPSPGRPYGARPANPRLRSVYLERVRSGRPAAETIEVLSQRAALGEAFFLALRRTAGLAAAELVAGFGQPPLHFFPDEIAALEAAGLLALSPQGDLRLTPRGRMLADSVCAHFV